MTLEVTLFLLRIVSGLLLLGLMVALGAIIWKDYRGAIDHLQANRRAYGKLITLQFIDGNYVVMSESYPLLLLTSLGRAPTNTIVIPDSFASNEHAIVVMRGGQWWLEDRHSRNGTTLNEVPITQPVVMTDGDIIGIGSKRFRLELER